MKRVLNLTVLITLLLCFPVFAADSVEGIYNSNDGASYSVVMRDENTLLLTENMGLCLPSNVFRRAGVKWIQIIDERSEKLGYTTPWVIEFMAKNKMIVTGLSLEKTRAECVFVKQ